MAANYYRLWEKDLEILKQLNQNAYRFSVEWSRIEPKEGDYDKEALNFYKRIIKRLKELEIKPFLTCWHFTNPRWFIDKGGWQSKKNIEYFIRYIKKLVEWFGEDIKYWIILNEPMVYCFESFILGKWPPKKKFNFLISWQVLNNLIESIIKSSELIHHEVKDSLIGQIENINYFYVPRSAFFLLPLVKLCSWINERVFRKSLRFIDFLGLNYYFAHNLFPFFQNKNFKKTDLDWIIYPEGLYFVLENLKKFNKPIFITENGLADANDTKREWYIKESLKSIIRAKREGIDIRGYFHWSLMDNFEWHYGFWPRFGLVEVNYKTFERKLRPSAKIYAEICKNNGLDI